MDKSRAVERVSAKNRPPRLRCLSLARSNGATDRSNDLHGRKDARLLLLSRRFLFSGPSATKDDSLLTHFANSIRIVRLLRGMNQRDLARRTGFAISYIRMIERGMQPTDDEDFDRIAAPLVDSQAVIMSVAKRLRPGSRGVAAGRERHHQAGYQKQEPHRRYFLSENDDERRDRSTSPRAAQPAHDYL